MKKQLSLLINFIISLFLFFFNLAIIIFSLKKIYKNDFIIIQNQRIGFGNIFTSIDLARKMLSKKILFIHFYDASRFHNKKIFDFLGEKKIILYSSIYFKSRKVRYGEYDHYGKNQKENFFQNFLIKIIKFFSDLNCKFYSIPDLYKLAHKKSSNLNLKKHRISLPSHAWLNYYFSLIDQNSKIKLNKKNSFLSKIINNQKERKTICIYIRNKKFFNEHRKSYKFYFDIINYFNNKKFTIYLVGEFNEFIKFYPKIIKKVNLPIKDNQKINENLSLAFQLTSDYYIGDSGGGAWFAMYKKNSVIIDTPEGFYMPNVKHFKYQIYWRGKRVSKKSKMYRELCKLMFKYDSFINNVIFHENNFTIKTENHNKIANYIKKKFIS